MIVIRLWLIWKDWIEEKRLKKWIKSLKMEEKHDKTKQNIQNLIKFTEDIIKNGVKYKNSDKNVSIFKC